MGVVLKHWRSAPVKGGFLGSSSNKIDQGNN